MNDWYIDRSKNFINSSFDPVVKFLSTYKGDLDSNTLIAALIKNDVFDEDAGNLYAALTRFRDHGLINNNNELGESALDYCERRLTQPELIIDLLIKRSATKKNSPNIKPLVVLCVVFDVMFDLSIDPNDIYLTYEECYKYLYNINDLQELTIAYIDSIITNRPCDNIHLTRNETINISIWANALRHTPLLLSTSNKSILKPNYYAKDLIKFIAANGYRISETPTHSNDSLYKYYCNRECGINEIIPNTLIPNIVLPNRETAKMVFNYLFGIQIDPEFDYKQVFTKECFGIYYPFIFVPGIAIRNIWIDNKSVGNMIYESFE